MWSGRVEGAGFRVEGGSGARRVAGADHQETKPGYRGLFSAAPGAMVSRDGPYLKKTRTGREIPHVPGRAG